MTARTIRLSLTILTILAAFQPLGFAQPAPVAPEPHPRAAPTVVPGDVDALQRELDNAMEAVQGIGAANRFIEGLTASASTVEQASRLVLAYELSMQTLNRTVVLGGSYVEALAAGLAALERSTEQHREELTTCSEEHDRMVRMRAALRNEATLLYQHGRRDEAEERVNLYNRLEERRVDAEHCILQRQGFILENETLNSRLLEEQASAQANLQEVRSMQTSAVAEIRAIRYAIAHRLEHDVLAQAFNRSREHNRQMEESIGNMRDSLREARELQREFGVPARPAVRTLRLEDLQHGPERVQGN